MGYVKGSQEQHSMNKAKFASPADRIMPKRWRTRVKAVPATPSPLAMWTPGPLGSCVWSSVSGRKVQLRPVSILNLTEAERLALQKIALVKLQALDIGCPVNIPSDGMDQRQGNKPHLSLKRRSKSTSRSISSSDYGSNIKDKSPGLVFGLPLVKCLKNERELEQKKARTRVVAPTDLTDHLVRRSRMSSSSSQGSLDLVRPSHKRAASMDSLSESTTSNHTSFSHPGTHSAYSAGGQSRLNSIAQGVADSQAQVPHVVRACFQHIQTYGLQTLGIFRVGSSKKRVKQLRDEFDSGQDVRLTEEHNPHDVGALLKEFFRDMPDPLLTRELYLPFLCAERVKDEHKRHQALSLLICLLPVANRDTLWALLQFLATVSQHARDRTSESGEVVPGNKMDTHNLATLFGPNIIHHTPCEKGSGKNSTSESVESVEQSREIIELVRDMIENHHELFEISGSVRDEVLRLLVTSEQEVVDRILRHVANQNQIETDPESMCSVFEESAASCLCMDSQVDLLTPSRRPALASFHRPLRVTRSADHSQEETSPQYRSALLSESQAVSPAAKDNNRTLLYCPQDTSNQLGRNSEPGQARLYSDPGQARLYSEPGQMRLYSEPSQLHGCSSPRGSPQPPGLYARTDRLNIPQPLNLRHDSSSSIDSHLSWVNGQGSRSWIQQSLWGLPTPPLSRGNSPKPGLLHSASSVSTLVATPTPTAAQYPVPSSPRYLQVPANSPGMGVICGDWDKNRWRQRLDMGVVGVEQETLV